MKIILPCNYIHIHRWIKCSTLYYVVLWKSWEMVIKQQQNQQLKWHACKISEVSTSRDWRRPANRVSESGRSHWLPCARVMCDDTTVLQHTFELCQHSKTVPISIHMKSRDYIHNLHIQFVLILFTTRWQTHTHNNVTIWYDNTLGFHINSSINPLTICFYKLSTDVKEQICFV